MAVQGTQSVEMAKLFELQNFYESKKGLKRTNEGASLFTNSMRAMIAPMLETTQTEEGIMALGRYVMESGSKEQHKQIAQKIRPIILKRLQECKSLEEAEFYKRYVDTFCKDQKNNYKTLIKTLKQQTKAKNAKVAENLENAKNRFVKYDYKAASESHVYKQVTPTQSRVKALDLEAAFGGKAEHVEQVSSYFDKPVSQIKEPAKNTVQILEDLANKRNADYNNPARDLARQIVNPNKTNRLIPEVPVKPLTEGEIYQIGFEDGAKTVGNRVKNLANLKKAGIIAAAVGGAVLLGAAIAKLFSDKDTTSDSVTPIVPQNTNTQNVEEQEEREYVFGDGSSLGFDTNIHLEIPKVEIPDISNYMPEEIANGNDVTTGNLNGKKVYVANKGDSVWEIAKKILAKSPNLKEKIKSQLKHPTEDGIIQVLTMVICSVNKINYYANPQTLPQIGGKVSIPDEYLKEVEEALKDKSLNEVLNIAA